MRFTIRDVLWLTLVAAVGAGWRVERSKHDQTAVHAEKHKSALKVARIEVQLLNNGWQRRGDPIDWRLADQKIPR